MRSATFLLLVLSSTLASAGNVTLDYYYLKPLDIYVNTPDPNYAWTLTNNTFGAAGWTAYTLSLTSQRWGVGFVVPEFELWTHQLVVVVPDALASTSLAHLMISGGSSTSGTPNPGTSSVQLAVAGALQSGLITATLRQVPNQPMRFLDSPTIDRFEDDTIAHTWRYFVDAANPDPERLLRFPMTKAAVRAMDAVEEFASQHLWYNIHDWAVSGASKRGWTTWTTAAVDSRVVAAIPAVMDLLDVADAAKHMYRMLNGAWTFAFNDYTNADLLAELDTPGMEALLDEVDPISFLERYDNIPVMCVTTGNDQFFMPDNTALWSEEFKDRRSPLYLRQFPNCEHSMANCINDVVSDFSAFLDTFSRPWDTSLPKFKTRINENNGKITVTPKSGTVLSARVWSAISADTGLKDFRANALTALNTPPVINQNVPWTSSPLLPNSKGKYVAKLDPPTDGRWKAFFIELEYEGAGPGRPTQRYTSETSIIPRTFPAEECNGVQCRGLGLV